MSGLKTSHSSEFSFAGFLLTTNMGAVMMAPQGPQFAHLDLFSSGGKLGKLTVGNGHPADATDGHAIVIDIDQMKAMRDALNSMVEQLEGGGG